VDQFERERERERERESERERERASEIEDYNDYKDGLQPETLADGNWPVKQNQPVLKIETKSDTNLRSLYES
jgi:hypothetical protein